MKSEQFYREADSIESGWGKYLQHIDKLCERVSNNGTFSLKEACWLMYSQLYVQSSIYLKFENFAKKESLDNLTWTAWKNHFFNWSVGQ